MRPAASHGASFTRILVAAAWLLTPATGLAQSAAPPAARATGASRASGCFDVVMPAHGGAPHAPLLFDQCSGASWLLVRDPVGHAPSGGSQRYRYRWFPIAVASVEAIMADAPVRPAASQQAAAKPVKPMQTAAKRPAARAISARAAAAVEPHPAGPPVKEN